MAADVIASELRNHVEGQSAGISKPMAEADSKRCNTSSKLEKSTEESDSPVTVNVSEVPDLRAGSGKDFSGALKKELVVCKHVAKGVAPSVVGQKVARLKSTYSCDECDKTRVVRQKGGKKGAGKRKGALVTPERPTKALPAKDVWLCLACGAVCCSSSEGGSKLSGKAGALAPPPTLSHVRNHATHKQHPLFLNLGTLDCWCNKCSKGGTFIDCSSEILGPVSEITDSGSVAGVSVHTGADVTPNHGCIAECVALVRESQGGPVSRSNGSKTAGATLSDLSSRASFAAEGDSGEDDSGVVTGGFFSGGRKVVGFSNLGNTCFFNSVLQNLVAVKPLQLYFQGEGSEGPKTPLLEGPLTTALRGLYSDLGRLSSTDGGESERVTKVVKKTPGGGKKGPGKKGHRGGGGLAYSPSRLFQAVCSKAPRFKGFQQQDAHEFLRHLLDGLDTEELLARKKAGKAKRGADDGGKKLGVVVLRRAKGGVVLPKRESDSKGDEKTGSIKREAGFLGGRSVQGAETKGGSSSESVCPGTILGGAGKVKEPEAKGLAVAKIDEEESENTFGAVGRPDAVNERATSDPAAEILSHSLQDQAGSRDERTHAANLAGASSSYATKSNPVVPAELAAGTGPAETVKILEWQGVSDPLSETLAQTPKIPPTPTFVQRTFGGKLSSTVVCCTCGHSSSMTEPFLDLSLPLPAPGGSKTAGPAPPRKEKWAVTQKKGSEAARRKSQGKAGGSGTAAEAKVGLSPEEGSTVSEIPGGQNRGVEDQGLSAKAGGKESEGDTDLRGDVEGSMAGKTGRDIQSVETPLEEKSSDGRASAAGTQSSVDDSAMDVSPGVSQGATGGESASEGASSSKAREREAGKEGHPLDAQGEAPRAAETGRSAEVPLVAVDSNSSIVASERGGADGVAAASPGVESEEKAVRYPERNDSCENRDVVNTGELSTTEKGASVDDPEVGPCADGGNEDVSKGEAADGVGPTTDSKGGIGGPGSGVRNLERSLWAECDALPAPPPMSLEGCLYCFTREEILEGENAVTCENCTRLAREAAVESSERQGAGAEEDAGENGNVGGGEETAGEEARRESGGCVNGSGAGSEMVGGTGEEADEGTERKTEEERLQGTRGATGVVDTGGPEVAGTASKDGGESGSGEEVSTSEATLAAALAKLRLDATVDQAAVDGRENGAVDSALGAGVAGGFESEGDGTGQLAGEDDSLEGLSPEERTQTTDEAVTGEENEAGTAESSSDGVKDSEASSRKEPEGGKVTLADSTETGCSETKSESWVEQGARKRGAGKSRKDGAQPGRQTALANGYASLADDLENGDGVSDGRSDDGESAGQARTESGTATAASEGVTIRRTSIKRFLIAEAPPILTVHLKRFRQDAKGRLSKIGGHVSFEEWLDVRPYLDRRKPSPRRAIEEEDPREPAPAATNGDTKPGARYCLIGCVEHSGSMRGGHYVAYVRGGRQTPSASGQEVGDADTWWYISDAHVQKSSLLAALRSEAYLLFYERVADGAL